MAEKDLVGRRAKVISKWKPEGVLESIPYHTFEIGDDVIITDIFGEGLDGDTKVVAVNNSGKAQWLILEKHLELVD